MSEPVKCKMGKQCYFQEKLYYKLFIAYKLACSCCFGLRRNLEKVLNHQLLTDLLHTDLEIIRRFLKSSKPKFPKTKIPTM